jgi:hypothetical protein
MRGLADAGEGEGVDARRARMTRKILLFAAVACAHAVVIALLLREAQTFSLAGANVVPIRVFLFRPAHRKRRRIVPPARLRALTVPVRPITAPITLTLPALSRPVQVARPINWGQAARLAVHSILKRRQSLTIGFPKGAHSASALHSAASGIRSQGRESYRTATGQRVARSSGNCSLESGPAPLDASQLEEQAQMSRVVCSSSRRGPSPDNLFKSLPAYQRYHTLPPLAVHPRDRASIRRKRPGPPPEP